MKNVERAVIAIGSAIILFCIHQYTEHLFKTHKWKGIDAYVWAAWIQAIGSIAAIFVAILVMKWQHEKTVQREESNRRRKLRGALYAIKLEFQQYQHTIASRIEDQFAIWTPIQADFTVFVAHASIFGEIDDPTTLQNVLATRLQILTFFTNANFYSVAAENCRKENASPDDLAKTDEIWAGLSENGPVILKGLQWVMQGLDSAIANAHDPIKKN